MSDDKEMILAHIKNTHENIAITLGVVLAMTLVAYFFTYSGLADSKYASWLWFEAVSSILIVIVLIKIQKVAFFLTKLRFMGKKSYQNLLSHTSLHDLKS